MNKTMQITDTEWADLRMASMTGKLTFKFTRNVETGEVTFEFGRENSGRFIQEIEKVIDFGSLTAREVFGVQG